MTHQMLAIVKEKAAPGVAIKKVPVPRLKKDEVLIKVLYASICGTDIGIYNWTPWAAANIKPPAIIGHEVVGEVIEINSDDNTNVKIGDLVSSETHIFDGTCYQCKIGNLHVCENLKLYGIGRDGGFAEFATIPIRTTWKNDPSISIKSMSVQEPLGNAVHVVRKAEVKNKRVLVVGLGPTGLCAGMVAKAYDAKLVVGLNRKEYRRKLAKRVGFDQVYETLPEKYLNSFDAVLEMSGSQAGIDAAFSAVRISGRIIAFGIPKEKVLLDWGKYIINKELTIESVFGRKIWKTWEQTSELLKTGRIDLKKIITHRFKLSEFEEAMTVMKSGECGKILLEI